jgi:DNA-binding NarL/FixJ family response regulator
MDASLPRSELLRQGRIALLDDETPEMLKDLQGHGLSIDHLRSTDDPNFQRLAEGFYDLLLLDYGGIGSTFGKDEGLDVLRYLRRINPALRILAFTARTFDSSRADFFRLCDAVVKKDSGTRETLEQIEFHLAQVLTPAYQLKALVRALGLSQEAEGTLAKAIAGAVSDPTKTSKVKASLKKLVKTGSETLMETLLTKLLSLGAKAIAGAL